MLSVHDAIVSLYKNTGISRFGTSPSSKSVISKAYMWINDEGLVLERFIKPRLAVIAFLEETEIRLRNSKSW